MINIYQCVDHQIPGSHSTVLNTGGYLVNVQIELHPSVLMGLSMIRFIFVSYKWKTQRNQVSYSKVHSSLEPKTRSRSRDWCFLYQALRASPGLFGIDHEELQENKELTFTF